MDNLPGSKPVSQADDFAIDELDYDPELDEAMSVPGLAEREAAKPRSRGLMVAAIVGAVAIAGGLGAFALSLGGKGGSEAPVIVKADNAPIKVKPENPGGAVVPNQDNKVYDAVAKGTKPAEPVQEKLVTNTEEPVDVKAKEPESRVVDLSPDDTDAAPGTDAAGNVPAAAMPGVDTSGNADAAPAPKSEDRIAQVLQEADKGTNPEVAAVAPRKVRTMMVKPDGSLVPREDPAPQVAAAEPTDPAPQLVAPAAQSDAEQTGTVAPATDQASDQPTDQAATDQAETAKPLEPAAAPTPKAEPRPSPPARNRRIRRPRFPCRRSARRPAGRRGRRGQARPGRLHIADRSSDRRWFVVDADRFAADGRERPVDLSGPAAPLWQRAFRPHRQHRQGRDRRQGNLLPGSRSGAVAQRCDQSVHQLQGGRRQLLRVALIS
ncbi:hypothetical protein AJ88_26440 [Mesorhizobium amorphae CCBAU 01583]|nr:hypothetical protein AJ88_26440 [Mesorhizobium amorphae CCBAU 01583]